jgi:hypothetical protein
MSSSYPTRDRDNTCSELVFSLSNKKCHMSSRCVVIQLLVLAFVLAHNFHLSPHQGEIRVTNHNSIRFHPYFLWYRNLNCNPNNNRATFQQMDFNEGFPYYIEVANFDGWLVQITAHLRGKNLHLALQEEGRPKPPVGEDNEPVVQTAAAKTLLTKSQDLWDAPDRAAMADLMKACRKDADTKLLTETGNVTTALSLLERLKERFKSTVSRQLDVAHQEFYNFAL